MIIELDTFYLQFRDLDARERSSQGSKGSSEKLFGKSPFENVAAEYTKDGISRTKIPIPRRSGL